MWDCSDDDDEDDDERSDTIMLNESKLKILRFIVTFLLSWQAIFRIPNVAVNLLFKFVSIVLFKLSDLTQFNELVEIANAFPDTLSKALNFQSISRDDFERLIVCSVCHSTYKYDQCLSKDPLRTNISVCSYVQFPRHPQQRMRLPCGSPLLKTVKTSSRKTISQPIKVFCCRSLVNHIKEIVRRPAVFDLLSHWKNRAVPHGTMCDIYDGMVWKSFLNYDGQEFLSNRYSVGLLLNVDWFKPYKHIEYSVGGIYIALLNLPRKLRYLKENVLLVGVMPGPYELLYRTTCQRCS